MQNRFFYEMKEDAREFFLTLPATFNKNRRAVLLFAVCVCLLAILFHPLDMPWRSGRPVLRSGDLNPPK